MGDITARKKAQSDLLALHHKMTEAQVRREMEPHPVQWKKTASDELPWQHFIVFEKRSDEEVREG